MTVAVSPLWKYGYDNVGDDVPGKQWSAAPLALFPSPSPFCDPISWIVLTRGRATDDLAASGWLG
eukprot:941780-Heterocapsa_arctica.AAC.1